MARAFRQTLKTMMTVLDRNLLVITGKGGTGKTTVAAALGVLAASRGLETIVVEVGDQGRLPALFAAAPANPGEETRLSDRLWTISIDPDQALLEWLQALGGRVPGRLLASSGTFQYFAAAAPGAKEMVSMVKIWELTERRAKRSREYDVVILDAPATGNALGLLRAPATFGAIARVGPIRGQAERVQALLKDEKRTAYLAVAQGTEMAISETLELAQALGDQLGRRLEAVIANALLPRRFSAAELEELSRMDGAAAAGKRAQADARVIDAADARVIHAAAAAARSIHERARQQHNLLARVRRAGLEVVSVPFAFTAKVDEQAIRQIADHLGRTL
jgi:anion-transporting  ArsA/GET3 family ATPase